jgi:hypothetical protein
MCRALCLVIALGSLAAAPGCSSCFGGGNNCRRPSFMEFRSPCSGGGFMSPAPCAAPCAPACAPACEPACGPACGSGCGSGCGESGAMMSVPSSAPVVVDQGTFS